MRGNIKSLTLAGVFAAVIFSVTFLLHIPAGAGGGYIHVGDAFVYLAASLFPAPLAMAAGAIGAGLSDLMTPGAAAWILPTVIIKPLCCLAFSYRTDKILTRGNLLAMAPAALITTCGYGIAAAVIGGDISVAVAELPVTLIQSSASSLCYAGLGAALDRTGFKQFIVRGR